MHKIKSTQIHVDKLRTTKKHPIQTPVVCTDDHNLAWLLRILDSGHKETTTGEIKRDFLDSLKNSTWVLLGLAVDNFPVFVSSRERFGQKRLATSLCGHNKKRNYVSKPPQHPDQRSTQL